MPSPKIKLVPWSLLGRRIGVASGWDQSDTFSCVLYDFTPYHGVKLPTGAVGIDFERGVAELYDDDGEVIESVDLVDALAQIPRK